MHSASSLDEEALKAYLSDGEKAGGYEWIVNEPETADESSPIGGSWKEYWKHHGDKDGAVINEWPEKCSMAGCTRDAEHGARVRAEDGEVSIVPMCAKDNNPQNKEDMRLKKDTIMVPAPR